MAVFDEKGKKVSDRRLKKELAADVEIHLKRDKTGLRIEINGTSLSIMSMLNQVCEDNADFAYTLKMFGKFLDSPQYQGEINE